MRIKAASFPHGKKIPKNHHFNKALQLHKTAEYQQTISRVIHIST